jgi:hypothetical protein
MFASRSKAYSPRPRWIPAEMVTPPALDHCASAEPAESYYALLINPFYPKDETRVSASMF